MQKNFQKLFKQLNSEQKKAVQTIEGPVLVLAGPGTGKTQVLALRIANILLRTQMNPYNILCLTFTETASFEMRERLIKIIGNDAYSATITTFHSFATSIISDYPHLFGYQKSTDKVLQFSDLKPLDDLARFQIVEKIIMGHNWQYLKPIKKNLHFIFDIVKALQTIKRERLENFKIQNPKPKSISKSKIQNQQNKINRTKELFKFYELYQKELEKAGRYDYEDMINWVVDALKTNRELRLALEERYQYILVDEFQDSNNAQIALLDRLTSFFGAKSNIFVVGDPNQSIYRFQGASLYNIHWFEKKFKRRKQISLRTNYRAPQNLIDTTKKILRSQTINLLSSKKTQGVFTLFEYENLDQEIEQIANSIKQLIKCGEKPQNIAILIRENSQIQNYTEALARHKIPFQTLRPGNIFQSPQVQKILAVYRFLLNPQNKIYKGELAFFLRDIIGLDQSAKLIKVKRHEIIHYKKISKKINQFTSNIIQTLLATASALPNTPPAKVLQIISDELKITKGALQNPDRLKILSDLKTLFDLAKNSSASSARFIEEIDSMIGLGISKESLPIFFGEQNAVVIQTAHSAKGSEYSAVYLPEMQESLWLKQGREYFALTIENRHQEQKEIERAESERLFYVALTRAKKNIFVSFSNKRPDDKNLSSFLIGLLDAKAQPVKDNLSQATKRTARQLQYAPQVKLSQAEQNFLHQATKNFVFSPTKLNSFIKCPQDFLYKHILQVPQIKKPSLAFGTAIHSAMENFNRAWIKKNERENLEFLLEKFKHSLRQEILDKKELSAFSKKGRELLENYYKRVLKKSTLPVRAEMDFKNHHVHLGPVRLTGKVDKIEWIDKQKNLVRVVDYKTGRSRSVNEILGKTKRADESYLNQLKFYWLIAELSPRFFTQYKIGECALEFLDDEQRFVRRIFTFSAGEIMEFKQKILTSYTNLQKLKFPHIETPGKPCEWCNY